MHKYVHYYILNFNSKPLKEDFLKDKNMPRVRLNFAPHAYLFPSAKVGEEYK